MVDLPEGFDYPEEGQHYGVPVLRGPVMTVHIFRVTPENWAVDKWTELGLDIHKTLELRLLGLGEDEAITYADGYTGRRMMKLPPQMMKWLRKAPKDSSCDSWGSGSANSRVCVGRWCWGSLDRVGVGSAGQFSVQVEDHRVIDFSFRNLLACWL